MTEVRHAEPGNYDALAAMLGRAFVADPSMVYIFPDSEERKIRAPRLFRQIMASDGKAGAVMTTLGGEAVTLWRAPGQVKIPLLEELLHAASYVKALGPNVLRAMALSKAIEAHMPKGRYWYLHIAGCDPAAQGKGFGKAAILAGLSEVVRDEACYLETGTERNLGFYRALGFEVTSEWRLGGATRIWSMLRPKP